MALLSHPPATITSVAAGLVLRQTGAPSAILPFARPNPPLFARTQSRLPRRSKWPPPGLALAGDTDGDGESFRANSTPRLDVVGEEGVPLEGVIQFDKPNDGAKARLIKSAKVALLTGGDIFFLLAFSAIGRFSHGLPVLDFETLRTADPFIAGWVLSAYFLGGYSEDGRGENGYSSAVFAAAKSWAVGIPLGLVIRTATSGHIPATPFMLVTMGSTAVLLIGWRAIICNLLSKKQTQGNDMYRRGSPFQFFELLTSLIRRW